MVKDAHPEPVKEAASTVLPVWLDAFRVLLNMDPQKDIAGANWDGLAIRIQVVKVRRCALAFGMHQLLYSRPWILFTPLSLEHWHLTSTIS